MMLAALEQDATLPRLARQLCLLGLAALLNPYTLFGRDPGHYWLAAFGLPLLLAGLWVGLRPADGGPRLQRLTRLSRELLLLVLVLQWADA